jgi:hypothetical protein
MKRRTVSRITKPCSASGRSFSLLISVVDSVRLAAAVRA